MTSNDCLICDRISLIQRDKNPYFVKELDTGFVVIGDHQFFKGYTLFLCKEHSSELHELDTSFRKQFLWEMSLVAEAVFNAFKPDKLNYELLGNTDEHMHWHIFPRHENDPEPKRAIWTVAKAIRSADNAKPNTDELEQLKLQLNTELEKILKKED